MNTALAIGITLITTVNKLQSQIANIEGVILFQDGNWREALEKLKMSLALEP
jgi:hypothetical protein